MRYQIEIKISTSRDPDSNPYTYTEIRYVRLSEHTEANTKAIAKQVIENFRKTLPYNFKPGTFLPTDVIVREEEK